MSQDTNYKSQSYIYRSRGLHARFALDQAPEYSYLQLQNCLERGEDSMSSRYGCQIINRDPSGVGTNNYYFTSPVTTLARLNYQGSAYRYAGLANGTLYRRTGNTQGAYSSVGTPIRVPSGGLSGDPFSWLITNTYASSEPWIFIYDADGSYKDNGSLSFMYLIGIDPPPYTANTVPYSPLLTLIDDFASGNSYTTTNVSGWAYGAITSYKAASAIPATDFYEFLGIIPSGGTNYSPGNAPQSATATQSTTGSSTATSTAVSGFSSISLNTTQTVAITVTLNGSVASSTNENGGGNLLFQYSPDGGSTWLTFYSYGGPGNQLALPTNTQVSFSINGGPLNNLNLLQFQVVATAEAGGPPLTIPSVTATGTITSVVANVGTAGIFAQLTSGMVAILGTTASTSVGIASIASSGLSNNLYQTLTIATTTAHGLTGTAPVAIYGCTNDLCDGFYTGTVTGAKTLTVPFISASALSATGGTLWSNSSGSPEACVLANVYASPYPFQFSGWGFYTQVPPATTLFPISAWSGTIAASTTGTIEATVNLDLSQQNQVTDDDLIVLTLQVGDPGNLENVTLNFDVNGSDFTASYYTKSISPAYYQGSIEGTESAYASTESQILADTLGLITGQPPNTTSAQLQPGNFSTGAGAWATIYLRRGDFLPVGTAGQASLDWSNITGWQIQATTNSNGTCSVATNGLYLQWGYGPSSFAGIGYDYRYTYFNANTFTESSPSPIQFFDQQYGYLSSLAAPIYLRQAAQITGVYSLDVQVTHLRIYRRGGTLSDNWTLIDQVPNVLPTISLSVAYPFLYKDVTPDASLEQATPLVLDNDPPVTSSLPNPIATTLLTATSGPGSTYYSTYMQQLILVQDSAAVFVPNQIVDIGNAANLEIVTVITGGTGQFTAIVRLQHNAGEQVNVYATPRQPCNLCAIAYGRVWLAGDPNNPHYLYYSKEGLPENFGPEDYIPVSSPDDPIMAVINWRGTLIVGTLKSWYIIVGGAQPYSQATGSQHGIIASQGWTQVESAVWYCSADGLREFTGADGAYKTLPVEWIFQGNPLCIPPQLNQADASSQVLAFYNNKVYDAYTSTAGPIYRISFDQNYQRFRTDDVPATAMLWEKDINTFLVAKEISAGNYAVAQDQIGDYDDGGWVAGALVETPINLTIQTPYRDLGSPEFPKQWNMMETDVNTQNQPMTTTLLFDDGEESVTLADVTTTERLKVALQVNAGDGQQAYRASIVHTIAVTVAPIIYQDNMYAAVLADFNNSLDTYWLKFGTDLDKFIKQGYFDYTSTAAIDVSLYADGSSVPYFTFTLPIQNQRYVQRVRFGNVNPGTTAFTMRTWRMIALCSGQFQMWAAPRVEWKPIGRNGYQVTELNG